MDNFRLDLRYALVLREGVLLAVPGVALGLIGAFILGRVLASALFGIGAADPATFTVTGAIQVVVALAAVVLPAHRAAPVDLIVALRAE